MNLVNYDPLVNYPIGKNNQDCLERTIIANRIIKGQVVVGSMFVWDESDGDTGQYDCFYLGAAWIMKHGKLYDSYGAIAIGLELVEYLGKGFEGLKPIQQWDVTLVDGSHFTRTIQRHGKTIIKPEELPNSLVHQPKDVWKKKFRPQGIDAIYCEGVSFHNEKFNNNMVRTLTKEMGANEKFKRARKKLKPRNYEKSRRFITSY